MNRLAFNRRNLAAAFCVALALSCAVCLQPAYADADDAPQLSAQSTEESQLGEEPADAPVIEEEAVVQDKEESEEEDTPDPDPVLDTASVEKRVVSEAGEEPTAGAATEQDQETEADLEPIELSTQAQTASVSYSTHVQNIGWQNAVSGGGTAGTTGKALRLEGLKISISGVSGSVVYQTHVQNIGWQGSVADGRQAGTTGQSLRLEALRIWLSGAAADQYDILYRAHVQNIGWQGWVANGALAGTEGKSLRLEAIEIKLAAKTPASVTSSPSVSYETHVQNVGWQPAKSNGGTAGTTGQSLRVEGLKIILNKGNFSGGISYQAHVQNVGWQNWVNDGALAGTTGQSLRVEALRVKLTGDIANKFDVQYRAHVQNVGWQPWVYNSMGTGSTGQGLRVEALEIKLVNKATKTGWEGSGSNWAYYENGAKTSGRWVVTDVAPMDEFKFDLQRYWIDGNGSMAVSRYVDPATDRDKKAGYAAYAMEKGYVLRDKKEMPGGILLADNDGRIPTTAGWLTTSAFDGSSHKYYLEKSGVAALAKTGMFTADGAKYYGMPGEGYVMTSGYWHLDGAWYAAGADGKLALDSNGTITKYIERYISWAIATANDNSHGYSQANRWGPDYDCSSFVVSSLKNSGFAVGGATWTGNMKSELTKYGFRWYTNVAQRTRGDIMLAHNSVNQHTEIFLGNNQIVGATGSENGGIYGAAGDQTGREIRVGTYYSEPWDGFLRYVG